MTSQYSNDSITCIYKEVELNFSLHLQVYVAMFQEDQRQGSEGMCSCHEGLYCNSHAQGVRVNYARTLRHFLPLECFTLQPECSFSISFCVKFNLHNFCHLANIKKESTLSIQSFVSYLGNLPCVLYLYVINGRATCYFFFLHL